jgi:thioredoxin-like negative regulator of GroEL
MTSLSIAIVLQVSIAATGMDDYGEARRAIAETGTPMVVMVGADWCPACQTMKEQVIPQIKRRGILRKVAFAVVNLDREREIGHQLTDGGPIPQLIMYRKTSEGWLRKKLVGNQSIETVETFISEGVNRDADTKHVQPASQKQEPVKALPDPERSAGAKADEEDSPRHG